MKDKCCIMYCPSCTSNLRSGSNKSLNLYACTNCGFVFKIQPIEPRPIKNAVTVFVKGVKHEH